jgi:hypothetical protein
MLECDPYPTLKKLYPYPISLLALLADHRGAVSGGQSLEIFVPGHGIGHDSDFDVYLPRNPDAIMDAMHMLRIAGVTWKNYVTEILNDIRQHNCAILPYQTLYSMAQKLRIHPENLKAYINVRFSSSTNCEKFALSFASALQGVYIDERTVLERYDRSSEDLYEPQSNVVWKYDNQNGTGTLVPLCETFERFTYGLLELLTESECEELIKLLSKKWEELELPKTFFSRYLLRRLRATYMSRARETGDDFSKNVRIRYIIDTFFPESYSRVSKTTEKRKKRKTKELAPIYPGFDFYMLRGTLLDRTRVQLMLFPPQETVLHQTLKFYATNVMSFVGGIFAAHLYHDSAEKLISYKLDISENKYKHKHSVKGISKYKKRGWTFEEIPKEKHPNRRMGIDENVKMVDYEDIYLSALRSQCGDAQEIPRKVKDYFEKRKSAFAVSTWVEKESKIEDISYVDHEGMSGSDHSPAGVLDWVHDALDGHKDVTPKAVWEEREKKQFVLLDLWFGGAGALAIHTRYLLQDISSEEYNWPDSDPDSDSDATLVEGVSRVPIRH